MAPAGGAAALVDAARAAADLLRGVRAAGGALMVLTGAGMSVQSGGRRPGARRSPHGTD